MGINKIKLKQIDADFSGLVGQYGSGYFTPTGSFYSLSGSSVKYSNLPIFETGNQNISGIKNFLSAPTLSGKRLAQLDEVVTRDGFEEINGAKDFLSDINFRSNAYYQNGEIGFSQSTFTFNDSESINSFANNFGTKFVVNGGTQSISGLKVFVNGLRVGGGVGSGVLYSGQINPIYVSGVSSNLNRYIIFAEGTGSGFKNAQMESGLNYNPSTKILSASTFNGVLINTSDRNLKTQISEIPDSWLDAWQEVDYVRYKFKDAVDLKGVDNARWHIGHIAQNIHDVFDKYGLNAFDIGMVCYDRWDESVDQNGNVTPSGEIWSIRPDECQFMELALMRRSINRLKSGIHL
jgi:hypothetical protein